LNRDDSWDERAAALCAFYTLILLSRSAHICSRSRNESGRRKRRDLCMDMMPNREHEFRPSSTQNGKNGKNDQNDAIGTSAFLHVQADWGG
jgi:hypothetical protein